VAARAAEFAPRRLLETAAGTGIVTRALRDALPAATEIVATDLNPPMLDIARRRFAGRENVRIEAADATALPFLDDAFDLVVCQFGLMFFPDKPASFREARRVLKPGGRYLFSVWDSKEKNRFAKIAGDAGVEGFEGDPPKFYDTPFSLWRVDELRALVAAADFPRLDIAIVRIDMPSVDPARFARALVYGNALSEEIRQRGGNPQQTAARI
jgi:SAM-dependent methyltransferase